jgi:hypothetical protein
LLYQYWKYSKNIIYFLIAIIISTLYFSSDILLGDFRIEKDPSLLTRIDMYEYIFQGIHKAYYFFQHGFNASIIDIENFIGEEKYPIHNDFLRYLYDWGVIWLIFLYFFFKQIVSLKKLGLKFDFYLILLFVFSNLLHNTLFSFYIWIPLLFYLLLKKKRIFN